MQNPVTTTTTTQSQCSSSSLSSFLTTTLFRDPKPILYTFLLISLFSILLILSLTSSSLSSTHTRPDPFLYPTHQTHRIIYDQDKTTPQPPSIAYLISGSKGDSSRILRLLSATYHPLNHYLLHLDPSAPHSDRVNLALVVQSNPIFKAAQNVHVMGKPDFVYSKGSSPVSFTLHAASILIRLSLHWDWFVSLSADSYPLVTQDDLLHIMSFLPKDMNFVNHSSYIGWKESTACLVSGMVSNTGTSYDVFTFDHYGIQH
ncbi:hypothetical protein TSUD_18600 [Trifolium subterraneum]|uniref:Uncharacterized protein n=1 Tax=Trifolium subterraneum TaxID=3900 RepID=A0A2Z6MF92_TRISU|nr:hypothetical protein TSUD_18600 [Trifolium subterraneum]